MPEVCSTGDENNPSRAVSRNCSTPFTLSPWSKPLKNLHIVCLPSDISVQSKSRVCQVFLPNVCSRDPLETRYDYDDFYCPHSWLLLVTFWLLSNIEMTPMTTMNTISSQNPSQWIARLVQRCDTHTQRIPNEAKTMRNCLLPSFKSTATNKPTIEHLTDTIIQRARTHTNCILYQLYDYSNH